MQRIFVFFLLTGLLACTARSPEVQPFQENVGKSDRYPPVLTLSTPHDGAEVGEEFVFGGTVSDDFSGVRRVVVSIDKKEWREADVRGTFWSTNLRLPRYSNYTLYVYAQDWKDRTSPTQQIHVVRVPFPVIVLEKPATGWYTNVTILLVRGKTWIEHGYSIASLRLWQGTTEVSVTLHQSNWQALITLQEGSNHFVVQAISDHEKTNTLSFWIVRDTSPPTIVITRPSTPFVGKNTLLSGSVHDESGARQIFVKRGAANWESITPQGTQWSKEIVLPSYGWHTNLVYAVDWAGNVSQVHTNSMRFHRVAWTIGIYMNADNDLDGFSLTTLKELERIPSLTNGHVNVVVLVDRSFRGAGGSDGWTGTRLYHMGYDDSHSSLITSDRLKGMGLNREGDWGELNMGGKQTLTNFVSYARENFPSTNFALILWGHWIGWKTREGLWDESSSDGLDVMEIAALSPHPIFQFIGVDGCTAGMIEVAYEWQHLATHMIASPDVTPREGWPYREWLNAFLDTTLSEQAFYTTLVQAYAQRYNQTPKAAIAVYGLRNFAPLRTAWTNYVNALYREVINPLRIMRTTGHKTTLLGEVESYFRYDSGYYHLDIWSLAEKMPRVESGPLTNALSSFVVREWHSTQGNMGTGNPFSHGIGVYFGTPFLDGGTWRLSLDSVYAHSNTVLSNFHRSSPQWRRYLRALHYDFPCEWIGTNTLHTGTMVSNKDRAWFKVYAVSGGMIDVLLSFGPQDYDLVVYDEKLNLVGHASHQSTNAVSNQEALTNLHIGDGWNFIRVKSHSGTGDFTLRVASRPVWLGGAVIK